MYSTVDYSVTPRPMYLADGRKLPDVYTSPGGLRDELQSKLGTFPLFSFWGPKAAIESTRWIAESAKHVEQKFSPTLSLVYLPHLDYNLQRVGPSDRRGGRGRPAGGRALRRSHRLLRGAGGAGRHPVGVRLVRCHDARAHQPRAARASADRGARGAWPRGARSRARVRRSPSRTIRSRTSTSTIRRGTTRCGAPREDAGHRARARRATARPRYKIDHARAGDLVAIAEPKAWFTYYYWLDDQRAPDFARTVDIHRKPGYDPVELLLDPAIRVPRVDRRLEARQEEPRDSGC